MTGLALIELTINLIFVATYSFEITIRIELTLVSIIKGLHEIKVLVTWEVYRFTPGSILNQRENFQIA
mgnify:CR=1 FL=1